MGKDGPAELPLGSFRGFWLVVRARMRRSRITFFLLFCLGLAVSLRAGLPGLEPAGQDLIVDGGDAFVDVAAATITVTNGAIVRYGNVVLTADEISANKMTGDVMADGRVRIQSDDMIWAGEHVLYNYKTKNIESRQFRTGKAPFYAGGEGVAGDVTNQTYTATNGYITLDDYAKPLLYVQAKRLVVRPNKRFEAHGATLHIGPVPVFYFPYYAQNMQAARPAFTVTPGYRSRFGPYARGSYAWNWGDAVDGKLHVDYRAKRGPGVGPDLDFHLGQWGDALFKYYYLYDLKPETNQFGTPFPDNRQRVELSWLASPFTNTTFKSRVSYQSDEGVRREFFEGEYRQNVQPSTFVEARHFWDNFALSVMAQPRVNDFFETVERLPEVKLSAFRQQIGPTPLYYESESRVGYLRRLFAETNGPTGLDYEAARADTYHQVVLPTTLFGWLNVTPRAGGRYTYYSEASGPGAATSEQDRTVFNTGAEVSFKASHTWAGAHNGLFDLDGLRHIIEPSVNYVYVPRPSVLTNDLPQFDAALPSLLVLPIDYPDYNAIDSVDSQNVIRWGLRNRLQTKRDGNIEDLLSWDVFADWRLRPEPGQTTFADLSSDLSFSPRSWITLESLSRYDIDRGQFRMAFNSLTLKPNTVWNWRLGYFYLRDNFDPEPTAWGEGNDLVTSTIYLRVNENWGLRASHYFDVRDSKLREQIYSLYRDFRSWTGAVSFRARKDEGRPDDYTIAFTFSIKALPRYQPGEDTIETDSFINY